MYRPSTNKVICIVFKIVLIGIESFCLLFYILTSLSLENTLNNFKWFFGPANKGQNYIHYIRENVSIWKCRDLSFNFRTLLFLLAFFALILFFGLWLTISTFFLALSLMFFGVDWLTLILNWRIERNGDRYILVAYLSLRAWKDEESWIDIVLRDLVWWNNEGILLNWRCTILA